MPRTGRNERCPCGSGRKYKYCHGAAIPMPAKLPDRRALEATTSQIARLVRSEDSPSADDIRRFADGNLERLNTGDTLAPQSPIAAAQDLMYDAWDASGRERIRLARQALALSPDCADAYVLLAEESVPTPAEALALYHEGVAAGERYLGSRLTTDVGHFWGEIDTRPYMRARAGLAEALWALGRRDEAIEHLWELLRLNPNDNQGVRDVLLPRLLELQDRPGARRLLNQFAEDGTAVFAFGRALLAYQDNGATTSANGALDTALRTNKFVADYLLGLRRLPRRLPDTFGFGDVDEAVICAAEHRDAWLSTEGAIAWLGLRAHAARDVAVQARMRASKAKVVKKPS